MKFESKFINFQNWSKNQAFSSNLIQKSFTLINF